MSKIKLCAKIWLKYKIRKYEKLLLEEGFKEAHRRKKNIQFGLDGKAIINEDPFERIYLPPVPGEQGKVDTSKILSLGAEKNFEAGRKFVVYGKILDRLTRHSGK